MDDALMDTDALIERAVELFNVDSYLRSRGLTVYGDRQEANLTCFRCHGKNKLYVNRRSKLFDCKRCPDGFRGGLFRLIMALDNCDYPTALALVLESAKGRMVLPTPQAPLKLACAYPEDWSLLEDPDDDLEYPYWKYLRKRRVDDAITRRYGIGYCTMGQYAGRIVVPVVNRNTLVSWVARDITGRSERKALTPTGLPQGATVFNLDTVRGQETVVVTEGVFDALRLPEQAVATFGKKLTGAQRNLLAGLGVSRLVFAWDPDAKWETARVAWEVATLFPDVRIAELPKGKDPSDMTEEAFRRCVEVATPIDDFQRVAAAAETVREGIWLRPPALTGRRRYGPA